MSKLAVQRMVSLLETKIQAVECLAEFARKLGKELAAQSPDGYGPTKEHEDVLFERVVAEFELDSHEFRVWWTLCDSSPWVYKQFYDCFTQKSWAFG